MQVSNEPARTGNTDAAVNLTVGERVGVRRVQTLTSSWPAVIGPDAMPSDETAGDGRQEVRGSDPLSSTFPQLRDISRS
jgi:hypothetical protein